MSAAMAAIFARLAGRVRAGSLTLDAAAERLVVIDLGDRLHGLDAHRIAEAVTRAKRALALAAEHEAGGAMWNIYGGADSGDLAAIQSAAEVDAVIEAVEASRRRKEESRLRRWGLEVLEPSDAPPGGSCNLRGDLRES